MGPSSSALLLLLLLLALWAPAMEAKGGRSTASVQGERRRTLPSVRPSRGGAVLDRADKKRVMGRVASDRDLFLGLDDVHDPALFDMTCPSMQRHCIGSRQCVNSFLLCDGRGDCSNSWDEITAECGNGVFAIFKNYRFDIEVIYDTEDFGGLIFSICNSKSCHSLEVNCISAENALRYTARFECNSFGRYCKRNAQLKDVTCDDSVDFKRIPVGTYRFFIERYEEGLRITARKADGTLPTDPLSPMVLKFSEQNFTTLRVRPMYMIKPLPSELKNAPCQPLGPETYHECDEHLCISGDRVCDGVNDCKDGTDELKDYCDVNTLEPFKKGAHVFAAVNYEPEHGNLVFSLCSWNCTLMRVISVNANDTAFEHFGYAWDPYGMKQIHLSRSPHLIAPGFEALKKGLYVFEIHRTDLEMKISLLGASKEKEVSYPIRNTFTTFKIRPGYWTRPLIVTFRGHCLSNEDHCGYPPTMCYLANKVCDGKVDCFDGRDEQNCKAVTYQVEIGRKYRGSIFYHARKGDVQIRLCSATSCSKVELIKHAKDGRVWYKWFVNCDNGGQNCDPATEVKPTDYWRDWDGSKVEFQLERLEWGMKVLLKGSPDQYYVSVEAPKENDQVLIRQVYGPADAISEVKFREWVTAVDLVWAPDVQD